MVWDRASRIVAAPPQDGVIAFLFDPTPDDSDSGWVTGAGGGAYQLRVGLPPGSTAPLVTLMPAFNTPHRVQLYEAHPRDPAVPEGKPFARLEYAEMGILHDPDARKLDPTLEHAQLAVAESSPSKS